MKVLVLLGGNSNEREVSLRSGTAVSMALQEAGHIVIEYDPKNGYAGLDEHSGKVDAVFPILHGRGGEDGEAQTQLEQRGFKYLGSDSSVSEFCFNKVKVKEKLNKLSILTPAYEIVDLKSVEDSAIYKSGQYVLKPISGGSTIDAFIVDQPGEQADLSVFDKYEKMLLEELIVGTEITISIVDGKALPVIEIIPPAGEDFNYENKYNGESQELCPPQHVSRHLQNKAQQIAEQVHKTVGARHLSRVDIMIDKTDRLWVLEINTMPGLTDQSLFPKAANVAGITMPQLVDRFVNLAVGNII